MSVGCGGTCAGGRASAAPAFLGERQDLGHGALDERVESAFTSIGGVGYLRLSAHLYTEPRDFDAFVERAVPQILAFADERRGQ